MEMRLEDVKSIVEEVIGKKYDEVLGAVDEKIKTAVDSIPAPKKEAHIPEGDTEVPQEEKGLLAARLMKSMMYGSEDQIKSRAEKSKDVALLKTLQASEFVQGGALIPENMSKEIIDLLTPKTVVRSMNPMTVPLINNLTMPKCNEGPEAFYTGELQDIKKTSMSFGQLKMTEKELNVLIPVSNRLLEVGGSTLDRYIRTKMLESARLKEDITFITGKGTEYAPKGLRYWAAAANVFPASATATIETVTQDALKAIGKLLAANVDLTNAGWIFNPLVWAFLYSMRDGNGNLVFAPQLDRGIFFGIKYKLTTALAASTTADVYLAAFNHTIVGDGPRMQMGISTEASYINNGQLVSAYSRGETLFKLTMRHDLIVEHEEAVVVITGTKWVA